MVVKGLLLALRRLRVKRLAYTVRRRYTDLGIASGRQNCKDCAGGSNRPIWMTEQVGAAMPDVDDVNIVAHDHDARD